MSSSSEGSSYSLSSSQSTHSSQRWRHQLMMKTSPQPRLNPRRNLQHLRRNQKRNPLLRRQSRKSITAPQHRSQRLNQQRPPRRRLCPRQLLHRRAVTLRAHLLSRRDRLRRRSLQHIHPLPLQIRNRNISTYWLSMFRTNTNFAVRSSSRGVT